MSGHPSWSQAPDLRMAVRSSGWPRGAATALQRGRALRRQRHVDGPRRRRCSKRAHGVACVPPREPCAGRTSARRRRFRSPSGPQPLHRLVHRPARPFRAEQAVHGGPAGGVGRRGDRLAGPQATSRDRPRAGDSGNGELALTGHQRRMHLGDAPGLPGRAVEEDRAIGRRLLGKRSAARARGLACAERMRSAAPREPMKWAAYNSPSVGARPARPTARPRCGGSVSPAITADTLGSLRSARICALVPASATSKRPPAR